MGFVCIGRGHVIEGEGLSVQHREAAPADDGTGCHLENKRGLFSPVMSQGSLRALRALGHVSQIRAWTAAGIAGQEAACH